MVRLNDKIQGYESSNVTYLAFLFVFCFITFAFPLLWGIPSGYDLTTDLRFTTALQDAMLSGQFFPGWAGDNLGYGSIGVRFYPPLAFYLLATTELFTANWFWAIWINLFFWMLLGVVGTFFFVREWGTPTQALIAGIGYAIVPQHLSDAFQSFLFAQFAAWALIPFCFLFVTRICRKKEWLDVLLFAVSYSALVLTHIPTTIILSLSLPIYVLVVTEWKDYYNVFVRLAAAISLTIAATSFRWLIVICEYGWLAHNDTKWTTGYFLYSQWLFPNTLTARTQYVWVLSSWLFDIAIVLSASMVVPAVIYLLKTRTARFSDAWRITIASVVTTLFAFFMLSNASQFVWEALPFLQKIQFPFRWLSVLSFCAVVAFAFSIPALLNIFRSRERLVAYPALALVVAIALFDLTQVVIPSGPLPPAEFDKLETRMREEPMFEGWWPIWATQEALDTDGQFDAEGREVEVQSWESTSKTIVVADGKPTNLRVPVFYYPHWKAEVNGKAVVVERDQFGLIAIPVEEGVKSIHLYFEEPLIIKLAGYLSLAIWLSLGLPMIWKLLKKFVPRFKSQQIAPAEA